MEEEKPQHPVGHEHQVPEEAAVDSDAAAADVVAAQDACMQEEELMVAAEEDGADRQDLADDEAIAQALYMEELMQMENGELGGFDEPLAGVLAGPQGPPALHTRDFLGVAAASRNASNLAGAAAVPRYVPPHRRGAAGGQQGQAVDAPHDARGGWDPWESAVDRHERSNLATPRNGGWSVGDGGEAVTVRLEARTNAARVAAGWAAPPKDDVIMARQAVLVDGRFPVVLAGMEEDGLYEDGWYESIARDARRLEEEDEDPGLHGTSFQQQLLPRSESPKDEEPYRHSPTNVAGSEDDDPIEFSLQKITKRLGIHSSELDPDEPGPSAKRPTRVPPLADDEVPQFDCGICMETLPVFDLFHGMQCEHRFCVECMGSYIEGRVAGGEVPIPCPDPACRGDEDAGVLHPEVCKKSLDFAAFSSWGDRLTEHAIPASRRAYCPNRRCGVMLETAGGKTPAMAACPVCGHLMCATCGLDWSADDSGQHDCSEGPEAMLVKKLAAERRWKQCPRCKMLVERTYGCNFMRCRCQFSFCYACGGTLAQQGQEEGVGEMCQCYNRAAANAHGFA
ncbi:hypothetical protein ACP70R_006351 [Stipagrostis hirtigluma subsp. patula]